MRAELASLLPRLSTHALMWSGRSTSQIKTSGGGTSGSQDGIYGRMKGEHGCISLNTVLSSLGIIEGTIMSSDSLNKGLIDNIIEALDKYAYDQYATSSRTGASFQAFLERHLEGDGPIKILRLSCSSTITSVIGHVLGKGSRPIHVHVLESRSLFEGVEMAQAITSFANENSTMLEVTVHTDAIVGVAARGIDTVLLGADLIGGTAAVSIKVGSLPTILTAKYAAPQAKIVVLSEKEKVLPFPPPEQEENDPSEVTQAWRGLSADLLDGPPLSKDGVTDAMEISRYAEDVAKKADQYFTNL